MADPTLLDLVVILVSIIPCLISGILYFLNELGGLIIAFTMLGVNIISQLTGLYSIFMEDEWTAIIMLGITIVVAQRIYFYLKDIKIFGFGG